MATHKAIALCRVSTSKQRIEGSSLEAQEARVNECADYLDADIKQLWSLDTSSRKGKNIARKDLKEMYEACKQDKTIRYIIVDEADRFMRSMEEAYWWKVQFKMANVYLAYANMPEITHEDNPMAVMREMMAFFQAEISNHERITKTTDKMQAKIKAGYYPGMVHQGYRKSDVPALHVPREPQWSLLKEAMHNVLYRGFSLTDALEVLNKNGYRLLGGGKIDMYKFKDLLQQPYYAGIIRMSDWDVVCEKGLHKAMITKEEHEKLVEIVKGKGKKFTVHKFNPLFPASNIVECADCRDEGKKDAKLVGYRHHNGKPERTRRFYERYRCRSCNANILNQKLRDQIDAIFNDTELIVDDEGEFLRAMRKALQADAADNAEEIKRLKQKKAILVSQKDALVRTMAVTPELNEDIKDTVVTMKGEVDTIEQAIKDAEEAGEKDLEKFVEFALGYVENLKENWWQAHNPDDRIRLKNLIYLDGLAVNREGKVRTPTLSPIYRYKSQKKTPVEAYFDSEIPNGGPSGTRTPDTLLKRQVL